MWHNVKHTMEEFWKRQINQVEEAFKMSTEGYIQVNKEKEQCWGEEIE